MNNKLILLAAAGTLALASCQSEVRTTDNDEVMQAKIDSAVQARMTEMQAQLAAQNDSLINAMAMMKADSMMAAMNSGRTNSAPTRSTRPTTRPTTTAPANTTPTNPGKNNGDQGTNTGKIGTTGAEGQSNEGVNTGKRR